MFWSFEVIDEPLLDEWPITGSDTTFEKDDEFREALITAIVAVKDLPGMDRYWKQRRGFFHTGFAEYVDGLLSGDAIVALSGWSVKLGEVQSDPFDSIWRKPNQCDQVVLTPLIPYGESPINAIKLF